MPISNTVRRLSALGAMAIFVAACGSSDDSSSDEPSSERSPTTPAVDTTEPTDSGEESPSPLPVTTTASSDEPSSSDFEAVVAEAAGEGSVTVYMSIVLEEQIKAGFAAAYPDIDVEVLRAASGELLPRLEQERDSGAAGADVAIIGNRDWFEANEDELLDPAGTAVADHWSEATSEVFAGGRYATVAVNPFYVGFNSEALADSGAHEIGEYTDLLQPELQGLIGITAPDVAPTIAEGWFLLDEPLGGKAGFEQLAALQPVRYPSIQPMAQALGAGEVAVGFIQSAGSMQPLIDQGAPLGYVLPDPAVGGGFWAAGLGWADHPNAARVFMDWLMSPDGQAVVAGEGLFLSVLPLSEFDTVPPDMQEIPSTMTVVDGVMPPEYDAWLRDTWNSVLG